MRSMNMNQYACKYVIFWGCVLRLEPFKSEVHDDGTGERAGEEQNDEDEWVDLGAKASYNVCDCLSCLPSMISLGGRAVSIHLAGGRRPEETQKGEKDDKGRLKSRSK